MISFEQHAQTAFGFLESGYDFEPLEFGKWHVRYESSLVFLIVHFDGVRSCEVGCAIGRLDNLGGTMDTPLDLEDVLRQRGWRRAQRLVVDERSEGEAVDRELELLASGLRRNASDLLEGDTNAYLEAVATRASESQEYAVETRLKRVRESLDVAWRAKDFDAVAAQLLPFRRWLSPAELRKLAYALKRQQL